MLNAMKTLLLLLLSFTAALAIAASNAQSTGPVARVNGVPIPQSRMDLLLLNAAAQGQPDTPDLRNRIREDLIAREIIAQEAARRGLDKSAEVVAQVEFQRQGVLVNAYLQDYFKRNPINEEALKKEYEQRKAQVGDKEYKARHILVKEESEARQVIAQLKKGANFEKLAAEKSEDHGSRGHGGDLEWSPPSRYVPAFAEALKKLKKGQLTEAPVQTQFGWHVIRLDDERALKTPSLDEVKPQLQQNLQQQAITKIIGDLRVKAKID